MRHLLLRKRRNCFLRNLINWTFILKIIPYLTLKSLDLKKFRLSLTPSGPWRKLRCGNGPEIGKSLEGDKNTAYFHALANQRRRKTSLAVLEGPNGPVYDVPGMLEVASSYYKDLFGFEPGPNISLDALFWDNQDLVTSEENGLLEQPFSEEEIKNAVFGSYAAGAPGPDGFPFLFYQKFWYLVKDDFMALVRDFHRGGLEVSRLNFSILTLIPKEQDAKEMKKFRPISLGNCSLKIITKAMTNRIAPIGDRIISSNQTAFIKG